VKPFRRAAAVEERASPLNQRTVAHERRLDHSRVGEDLLDAIDLRSTPLDYRCAVGFRPLVEHHTSNSSAETQVRLIRFGDVTEQDGEAIIASSTVTFDDRPVARMGDEVLCPRHPEITPKLIGEGDESMMDDNLPIAHPGHRPTCGCQLISSLSQR
jgi:uncharacterized Zn-binding protein involved in type VI secretion